MSREKSLVACSKEHFMSITAQGTNEFANLNRLFSNSYYLQSLWTVQVWQEPLYFYS